MSVFLVQVYPEVIKEDLVLFKVRGPYVWLSFCPFLQCTEDPAGLRHDIGIPVPRKGTAGTPIDTGNPVSSLTAFVHRAGSSHRTISPPAPTSVVHAPVPPPLRVSRYAYGEYLHRLPVAEAVLPVLSCLCDNAYKLGVEIKESDSSRQEQEKRDQQTDCFEEIGPFV